MGDVYKKIDELPLNSVQKAAIQLIQCDLKFLYTIFIRRDYIPPNYYVALMPYMGLIVDGVEDWIKAYNNSSKVKLEAPVFTVPQQAYYEEMRKSIKLYEKGAESLNQLLRNKYQENDRYFSSVCKPIAKHLRLYDVFGVFSCNGVPCDNTILDQCFSPYFQFGNTDGKRIQSMAEVAGKYVAIFNTIESYSINENYSFSTKDYGGFVKSPLGRSYNVKFMLFSITCQINFVVKAVSDLVKDETPTKLMFSYLLYYYLCDVISSVNDLCKTSLTINKKYFSKEFRNSMAHYKLGVSLKKTELKDDPIFGLSQKVLNVEYFVLKKGIIDELTQLNRQIDSIILNK